MRRPWPKLDYFILRDDASATNIHVRATCCGTLLFCQHPGFHVPHTMATFGGLKNTFVLCRAAQIDLCYPAGGLAGRQGEGLEGSLPLP
eukprot:5862470-Prymnesium_polylepis.2